MIRGTLPRRMIAGVFDWGTPSYKTLSPKKIQKNLEKKNKILNRKF